MEKIDSYEGKVTDAYKYLTWDLIEQFQDAKKNRRAVTPLGSVPLIVKYFTPDAGWTWYASQYDEDDQIFYGFVVGKSSEWGYFALEDIETVTGALRLHVERDLHWTPKTFEELRPYEKGE